MIKVLSGGLLLLILGVVCSLYAGDFGAEKARFLACGWGNLVEFEADFTRRSVREVWTWHPGRYAGIPADFDRLFEKIDECKPIRNGEVVLITASTSGVGIVNRRQKTFQFIGQVGNAHSIDLLPGERVAVAGSHRGKTGDRLAIFDLNGSHQPLFETALPQGHGVYWEREQQQLWALAGDELRRYRLQDWSSDKPRLELLQVYPLPEAGGHDLRPVPNTSLFTLTTGTAVWRFDRVTALFSPHPELHAQARVKSTDRHPDSGRLLWIKADDGGWWSHRLRFGGEGGWSYATEKRFYKARWLFWDRLFGDSLFEGSALNTVYGLGNSGKVLVVAHRSCWRMAPENSLKAMDKCIELGVDMLEIDVRKTRDNQLVVIHDETVDRTTRHTGLVNDYTLAQLQGFRLREGEGGANQPLTDSHIPSLRQVLEHLKDRVLINLDAKESVRDEAMQLVEQLRMTDQVIIKAVVSSPKDPVIQSSRYLHGAGFMPIIRPENGPLQEQVANFHGFEPAAFEVIYRSESELRQACVTAERQRARCWVNTMWESLSPGHSDDRSVLDPDSHWGHLVSLGVNMFQTDRPDELIAYLESKGLR